MLTADLFFGSRNIAKTELRFAEDALSAARQALDETKAKLDRLIALYQAVEGLPINRIVQVRDQARIQPLSRPKRRSLWRSWSIPWRTSITFVRAKKF